MVIKARYVRSPMLETVTDMMTVHWIWRGYHPWAIDWHRDLWPWSLDDLESP